MASETMIHEGQAARDWAAQAEPQYRVGLTLRLRCHCSRAR